MNRHLQLGILLSTVLANPAAAQIGANGVFELSEVNGSNGLTINGQAERDFAGTSVGSAGDFNDDGIDDIIIGADGLEDVFTVGGAYVVFGSRTGLPQPFQLSSINGSNGVKMLGVGSLDDTGTSVEGAGDVNGDGIDDVVIGADDASINADDAGSTYVVFGRNTGFPATLDLAGLNGANGFTINGIAEDDISGRSVSGAGDVNGDGIDDIIIGAFGVSTNGDNAGAAYLVFGRNTGFGPTLNLSSLNGVNGFVLNGLGEDSRAGFSVGGVGDFNGDDVDDFIIGADGNATNGEFSGTTYIVYGSRNGFPNPFQLATIDGSNGIAINGANAGDQSGGSVSGAGDVNSDGVADVIIGAAGAAPGGNFSGAAYVVFGSDEGPAHPIELAGLNGENGFVINGNTPSTFLGDSVSGAGDINGDGIDDVIVGAPLSSPNGPLSGASYVIYGKSGTFTTPISTALLDSTDGFVINGAAERDDAGRAVGMAGDFNGDRAADLLIGAPRAAPNAEDSGSSYVLYGAVSDPIFNSNFELPPG